MIQLLLSVALGLAGCLFFLIRRTIFSVVIGVQWIVLSLVVFFIVAGHLNGKSTESAPYAFLIALAGVGVTTLYLAVLVRLLYLRKRVSVYDTRGMRH